MKVFLFDIDGTLINTGGAGRKAMSAAFQQVAGRCDCVDGVPFSGRTDRAIGSDLFRAHQLLETPERWSQFRTAYFERLPKELEDSPGVVLPGVQQLLHRLAELPNTAVGLLTGNFRTGARIKLEHYGIFECFTFGGFGDDHHDRSDVAREALAEARREFGQVHAENVWVIGDTAHDVACGRAIGANVLAVRTGFARPGELESAKPDLLVEDLASLPDESALWE